MTTPVNTQRGPYISETPEKAIRSVNMECPKCGGPTRIEATEAISTLVCTANCGPVIKGADDNEVVENYWRMKRDGLTEQPPDLLAGNQPGSTGVGGNPTGPASVPGAPAPAGGPNQPGVAAPRRPEAAGGPKVRKAGDE